MLLPIRPVRNGIAIVLIAIAGCARPEVDGLVRVDGSSTVYPIVEAVAEEFQARHRGEVRVTVGISGTGGGFKKFCRGDTDLTTASRPILPAEAEICASKGTTFIELPIAIDALSVVVHPDNHWARTMSVVQLRRIWAPAAQGTVLRWNQVEPDWPDRPLRLYGPGVDSGTFDYFTEAIVGQAGASRRDFTASEDDNHLVTGIAQDVNALGFFGFTYYRDNAERVQAVAIRAEAGTEAVLPSMASAIDGSYRPLSRPVFVYVNAEAVRLHPQVEALVDFLLDEGPALIEQVRLIALPQPIHELTRQRFQARRTGRLVDGGVEVGHDVERLLRPRADRP